MRPLLIAFLLILTLAFTSCTIKFENSDGDSKTDFWKGNYFVQENVKTVPENQDHVEAEIEDEWHSYDLQNFTESFMAWNLKSRKETLEGFMMHPPKPPRLAGPHNGMVATWGNRRDDSQFSLNNAVKGMGFCPKESTIEAMIQKMNDTMQAPFQEKLDVLMDFYNNADSLFYLDRQISLELYSTPEFETQSFLNQMTYPVSTVVFLDIPSYKLKTITRLLHPQDPNLTRQEKLLVDYVNIIHSYFHGEFDKEFSAVIYYVVEIYDNSPGKPDARGTRLMPPLP